MSVLPEPVSASPIASIPFIATGQPCRWMAVGVLKPTLSSASRMYCGKEACTKEPTGFGQRAASPWIVMHSCARSACTCSGVSAATSGCSR